MDARKESLLWGIVFILVLVALLTAAAAAAYAVSFWLGVMVTVLDIFGVIAMTCAVMLDED